MNIFQFVILSTLLTLCHSKRFRGVSSYDFGAQCSSNPICKLQGEKGSCCPNKKGIFENCCNRSCNSHDACSALTGNCCPSTSNVELSCCDHTPKLNALLGRSMPVDPPTESPSKAPTDTPSSSPSSSPSEAPSATPSSSPSEAPSATPSASPSSSPSLLPSDLPSLDPSSSPSAAPSAPPSLSPSAFPSASPSASPNIHPSAYPTASPTFAMCNDHLMCATAGLVGTCCPTPDGVFLDCCNTSTGIGRQGSGEAAACSSNPRCAGLSGDCCPTKDGVHLDCCVA